MIALLTREADTEPEQEQTDIQRIGAQLREWRHKRGWSLRQMEAEGAKLGYKFLYSTIQQIEAGVVPNPHFATVRAIMHILGRSLAELDVPPDPDLEQISQLVADI